MWWAEDLLKFTVEQQEIEKLREGCAWLKGIKWRFDSSARLMLEADIEAHGHLYSVTMTYPEFFPALPLMIYPADKEERWSLHQHPGGELCLEWGPDNWVPEVTGAMMLSSFYKLVEIENPKGKENSGKAVDSRHSASLGRSMRNTVVRLLMPFELGALLSSLPLGMSGDLSFTLMVDQLETTTAIPYAFKTSDEKEWTDTTIPERLRKYGVALNGMYLKLHSKVDFSSLKTQEDLLNAVKENENDVQRLHAQFQTEGFASLLVQDSAGTIRLIRKYDENKLLIYKTVLCNNYTPAERAGSKAEIVEKKKVGIVGLGSAGSKVAVSLARSGVCEFVLVDEDLFLPENICRHSLDWRSVGEHKVTAVMDQITLINARAKVDRHQLKLDGQESTTYVDRVLQNLASCDLIIDATASGATFNLLGAVAEQKKKGFIWLEILGGGAAGIISRYRPSHDISPHRMRETFGIFTTQQPPAPVEEGTDPYADGIHIATDADVSVIAAHTTRFAIDFLSENEPSIFSHSIYLIGLRRWWIFEYPFHVIQIETGQPEQIQEPVSDPDLARKSLQFLRVILAGTKKDESNTPEAA